MHATIRAGGDGSRQARLRAEPRTWSVAEARQLSAKAKSTRVATQMATRHSWTMRGRVEYVWATRSGDVKEVHVWTNRPLGYWRRHPRPESEDAAASGFRWTAPARVAVSPRRWRQLSQDRSLSVGNLFLGVAPFVEYFNPVYTRSTGRGLDGLGFAARSGRGV